MIIYLLKCTIAMGISWLIYRNFLVHQKSFFLNRIYLLTAVIGSTLAPLVLLPSVLPKLGITDNIYPLLDSSKATHVEKVTNVSTLTFTGISYSITWVIITISVLLALRFIYGLIKLIKLTLITSVENKEGISIAIIKDDHTPFSFFKTIYVDQDTYSIGIQKQVYLHEKYHIQQLHSVDRIIIEILLVFQWMNPFVHLFKRELIDNHEYAADAYAIDQTHDLQKYLSLILKNARPIPTMNFLSQSFAHSSSKKRIKMITTIQKNGNSRYGLFAFLLLFGCLISCSDSINDPSFSHTDHAIEKNKKDNLNGLTNMGMPTPPPPPLPAINQPSRHQLENWLDSKKFGIKIDWERVDNEILYNYNPDDFSLFAVYELRKNSKDYGKFKYGVALMTNEGYHNFDLKREKLTEEYEKNYAIAIKDK